MERQALIDALQKKGYKVSGAQVFGVVEEYPFTITCPAKGNVKNCTVQFMVDGEPDRDSKKIAAMELKGIARAVTVQGVAVTLTLKEKRDQPLSEVLTNLERVTALLRNNNMFPPTGCAICKQGETDAYIYHALHYAPVHQTCVEERKNQLEEKIALNEGSYLLGIIGAILGGLIGCIPSMLSIWFMESIFSLLYALIPLGAYYGYKLLRGKLNWVAVAVTVLVSLASVLMMEFILMNIYFAVEYDMPFFEVLGETLPWLAEGEFLLELVESGADSLLFLLLGIFISWGQITRTNKSGLKQVVNQMNTLIVKQAPALEEQAESTPAAAAVPAYEAPAYGAPAYAPMEEGYAAPAAASGYSDESSIYGGDVYSGDIYDSERAYGNGRELGE